MCPRRAPRNPRTPGGSPITRLPGLLLGAALLTGAGIFFWPSPGEGGAKREIPKAGAIQNKALSSQHLRQVVSEIDTKRLWLSFIQPMLIERVPGSSGNLLVRKLISGHLQTLSAGWSVDVDEFDSVTPRGTLPFGNVIATLDPSAPRRVVLACHLDSKWFPPDRQGRVFIGATDSAVPCALILEVVTSLDIRLRQHKNKGSSVTLQLLFLDGEEAFEEWSETDSLYGARHLAQRMEEEPMPGGGGTQLDAIEPIIMLRFLAVLFALCAAAQCCPTILTKAQWGGRSPTCRTAMATPVTYAIIHHTATGACSTQSACTSQAKSIQNYHIDGNGWCDMGYNFLVGGEGTIYEGRGWTSVGAHAPNYNSNSIGISLIGTFTSANPTSAAQTAAKNLIACGVTKGYIKSAYILKGHRNVTATECPGNTFYNTVKTWPRFQA
ncbi:glutaminyl-peptide cyclotransferase-like protein isoform X1 [Hyperolius riggenbachi]|uniref:glutaminyl-peptide cyclotransferase-like protein isoform X1 n=1 Tax=Hyperolius riggenbachi TaxID=752182 RepID=UPI0035A38401